MATRQVNERTARSFPLLIAECDLAPDMAKTQYLDLRGVEPGSEAFVQKLVPFVADLDRVIAPSRSGGDGDGSGHVVKPATLEQVREAARQAESGLDDTARQVLAEMERHQASGEAEALKESHRSAAPSCTHAPAGRRRPQGEGHETMSESDRPSATTPHTKTGAVTEPITRQTKIAEVVDYPLELYARERSRYFEENPKSAGFPVWLVLVLIVAFLAVVGLALATGPTSAPTLVSLGVLVVILVVVLQVRASATGALPAERIKELEDLDRTIKETFKELGIKCHGCGAAYVENFEQGAKIHGFDAEQVVAKLNTLGIDLADIRYEEQPTEKATKK